ncbi:hypothetical protein D3C87_2026290 [compost metagenome]
MPSRRRAELVTNRSSPTSWHLLPMRSVTAFQPSQSSSAMPSSIEKIGYLAASSARYSAMAPGSSVRPSPSSTYLPSLKNSVAAQSSAMNMSSPGL